MDEPIIRIAAKGDGVTASGRFAWGVAPGDLLRADGSVASVHARPFDSAGQFADVVRTDLGIDS